jgi:hypothetical protein
MITITAFAVADSRAPRISSRQHSVTSTIAGRLKNPPSPVAASMAPGMRVAARRSLRIEDYVGHLPGSPLVLKEGEELLRSATGVKWARPIAMNALSQLHWCG